LAVEQEGGFKYLGIDTSINPALSQDGSVAYAFESLLGKEFRFGGAGTLGVARALTSAVKDVQVKRVGYCGLMLPILEDLGQASHVCLVTLSRSHVV